YRGGDLGNWGGVGERSMSDRGRCVGQRSGVCDGFHGGYWSCGECLDSDGGCFFADNSVESIYWISGVIDGAFGPISLDEGVAALNDVSVAGLLLALSVASQTVVHVVRVAVLRMGVEVGVDGLSYYSFSYGGSHCNWRRVSQGFCRAQKSSVGGSHEGGEYNELRRKIRWLDRGFFLLDRRDI
ncbi:hypothetical protein WN51_00732, partial [Melipona quadrifasciata]